VPPRVFNIAPGIPFLEVFVRALYDGHIIPKFGQLSDPLALAKLKIYVPTRRAAQALAKELARQTPGCATLLPKILPLGALESQESEPAFDDPYNPTLPRAVSDIERRMILGELILTWAKSLKRAMIAIDRDGTIRYAPEAMLVATQPADAWRLSGELANLIDDMIIENVAWKTLQDLNADFDEYWRITLNFLNIAIEAWPKIRQERGFVDESKRQIALIYQAIAEVLATDDPVIALGSTGSNIVTAKLLANIARAENGAVILPGLDMHLDDPSFAALRAPNRPSPTHPQAFLARLIETIGIDRHDVMPLGLCGATMQMREKFVSESFRPAESTDLWTNWRVRHDTAQVRKALDGVTLVEAVNEREEALAIAICLREALEDRTRTAALVTPDRALAERVRAEMLRWNIEIDDSGGVQLAATPAGAVARLALRVLDGECKDWAALVAHPLVNLGMSQEVGRLGELFEIGILRAGINSSRWREAVRPARKAAEGRDAHPQQKAICEADWAALNDFAVRLDAAVEPLFALGDKHGLAPWLAAHRAVIGLLCGGDAAFALGGEDGQALADLFDEVIGAANQLFVFDHESYVAFFDALISEKTIRRLASAHPRLQILGLLEARLIGVSRLIVAGLDECIWPPQAAVDSFLNRPMREALGLSSVDRRIGQTAHDFCQALGAPEVILTRAKKRGGAPTIASRFLQRMEALAGNELFTDLRRRGDYWLQLTRRLDQPEVIAPLRRPQPRPAVNLRPKSLSITSIEMLRRDPYAIYARHILRLARLPGLDEDKGLREIGMALHSVLEQFGRAHPSGLLPTDARSTLINLARTQLMDFTSDAEFEAFRWPRLLKGLDVYLAFEDERRPRLDRLFVEASGALAIVLNDGAEFMLTGKADRIELQSDGAIALADYKTGDIPTYPQIRAGFAPQLTLEAAMVERGAFRGIPKGPVVAAFYVPIGGGKDNAVEIKSSARAEDQLSFQDLVTEHFYELVGLLSDFRNPAQGYPARPFPQFAARYNDYDHLARTREWSAVGGINPGEDP
jgi:ATP-dependent helicase/nuclease subunit B